MNLQGAIVSNISPVNVTEIKIVWCTCLSNGGFYFSQAFMLLSTVRHCSISWSKPRSQGSLRTNINRCVADSFLFCGVCVEGRGLSSSLYSVFILLFLCYQIWYGDAASWARVSCIFFVFVVAIFKVKVAERAHMIKIWLFLLYFLNCWFLGN